LFEDAGYVGDVGLCGQVLTRKYAFVKQITWCAIDNNYNVYFKPYCATACDLSPKGWGSSM